MDARSLWCRVHVSLLKGSPGPLYALALIAPRMNLLAGSKGRRTGMIQ